MNTNPSAALQENTPLKAVDSIDAEFFIFNGTSQEMLLKFTTDDTTPADMTGAILILPYKGVSRGVITGYPWLTGKNNTIASITA